MPASRAHLIRHGEVENPHHVVYADLPGYDLSPAGVAQAEATAAHLAERPIERVVSSPLLRARSTAAAIAGLHGITVEIDQGLTEWALAMRWAGVRWDDLDRVFPGELAAYLEHPTDLAFAPESLQACGARVAASTRAAASRSKGGDVVIVGHQDPIHCGHLALTGATWIDYHTGKPSHASVISLAVSGDLWEKTGYWEPEQGAPFPPVA